MGLHVARNTRAIKFSTARPTSRPFKNGSGTSWLSYAQSIIHVWVFQPERELQLRYNSRCISSGHGSSLHMLG
jgi:hypothetical protein